MRSLEAFYSFILGIGILYAVFMFVFGGLCRGLPRICPIRQRDRPAALSRLNPLTVASTLIAFGATGLSLTLALGIGPVSSLFFSLISAAFMSQATFSLVSSGFFRTYGSSGDRAAELVGAKVEVSATIEPGGTGEISFISGGAVTIHPARAADLQTVIPKGSLVRVLVVEGDTALVQLVE